MEPRWRTAAFLKTVSILNVYNIPFLVFATILWTITVRPLDAVFHQKTLLLAHTILTLGAVASLGYGAIGCLFIMNATWATATLRASDAGELVCDHAVSHYGGS